MDLKVIIFHLFSSALPILLNFLNIKFSNYFPIFFCLLDYPLLHYSGSSLNPVDIATINPDQRGSTVLLILFSWKPIQCRYTKIARVHHNLPQDVELPNYTRYLPISIYGRMRILQKTRVCASERHWNLNAWHSPLAVVCWGCEEPMGTVRAGNSSTAP
jgi:hypothetical protein